MKKQLFFFTFSHSNHPNFLKKSHNSGPIPVLRKRTHIRFGIAVLLSTHIERFSVYRKLEFWLIMVIMPCFILNFYFESQNLFTKNCEWRTYKIFEIESLLGLKTVRKRAAVKPFSERNDTFVLILCGVSGKGYILSLSLPRGKPWALRQPPWRVKWGVS